MSHGADKLITTFCIKTLVIERYNVVANPPAAFKAAELWVLGVKMSTDMVHMFYGVDPIITYFCMKILVMERYNVVENPTCCN